MDPFLRLRQFGAGILRNPGTKFLRDLAVLALGQIGSKILIFLSFAYLARALDPASYGAVEFAIALTGFFAITCDLGMGPVGVRERAHQSEIDAIAARIPAIRLLLSILAVPVMVLVAALATDDDTALGLALLFALSLPVLALNQNWLQQSLERMDRVALGEFLRAAVFAVAVILLVGGSGDIFRIGGAELLSVVVFIGFFLVMQRRAGLPLRLRFTGRAGWSLFRKSLPLGASNMIWDITYYLPPVFVAAFVGLVEAAFFAAALRLVVSVQSFSYIYHFNLFTSLARRHAAADGGMARLAAASFRILAWGLIGPVFLTALVAGDVMALIFGETFRVAGPVLAILILALPIQFLADHARWGLVAAGHDDAVFAAGFAGAIVSLLVLPALTFVYGGIGAASGVVLAAAAIWIVADWKAAGHDLGLPRPMAALLPAGVGALVAFGAGLLPGVPWPVLWGAGLVLYCIIAGISDRRIFPDLRHLAYAKSDAPEAQ